MSDVGLTGPQHWRRAEQWLEEKHAFWEGLDWKYADTDRQAVDVLRAQLMVAEAQVHATLALTATTYERTNAAGNSRDWLAVLSGGARG